MAGNNYEAVLRMLLEAVEACKDANTTKADPYAIPVGVSNRHIHLSQADLDTLFGKNYQLTHIKDLSQPGQFACKEVVTICGPKGSIEKVRILGPVRSQTQVEILAADCFKLGVTAPAKLSGDLQGTPGITVVGPKGSVQISEGVMIAQRHIHMLPEDAQKHGVKDGDIVSIIVDGPRGGTYGNVVVRANNQSALECHLDTEEANAMNINSSTMVRINK